ncbi:MAG TPA: 6-phosphogluconolactonase [Acidimicrobiia bacterium]|nr:6-phosphogluconolactonase [Acidimicrobiia bacterium]
MSSNAVIVHRDPDHLAEAAAARIADIIGAAATGSPGGRVSLGLAGGSTPASTYSRLRTAPVDWQQVDAWMSDERWVPHQHEDSNGRVAAELLMDHVPARFMRPRWAAWLTAGDSAAHYEAELRSVHPDGRSHLILLGMGDDGHTASLFPGTEALDAPAHRWFVANEVPQLNTDRLTATYRFIRQAHDVMVLVAGGNKAPALRQVLEPVEGEPILPATGVMGGEAAVTWMIDEAAAAELSQATLTSP